MTQQESARFKRGAAITAGVLACLGAVHRLLSAIGAAATYLYLDAGSDRVRAAFGPARTILAISIPICSVIGILLLAGGTQLFRRKPSARWLIITGCAIDIAYIVIEYIAVRVWASQNENQIMLGGPVLLAIGLIFPIATVVVTLINSTSMWISNSASATNTRSVPAPQPGTVTSRNPHTPPPHNHDPRTIDPTMSPLPPPSVPRQSAKTIAPPSSRTRNLVGPAVAFIAGIIVTAATVTAAVIITPSDEPTSTAAVSTAAAPPAWGGAQWIVDMFPKLFPTKPTPYVSGQSPEKSADGWRGLSCQDDGSTRLYLRCYNDFRNNPMLFVYCIAGKPYGDPVDPDYRVHERLPRPSGIVTIWSRASDRVGVSVTFGDSQRGQCRIDSGWANHSAEELIDWWRSAPL
ncbi:hypothetical protein ACQP1G_12750 [Nocardia sp. CA-107356]|uniref:hypothetical protein n=1 Tax=Nocardia sp. CA-107356 TaxID=3239972 RepID=UPI003D91FD09